MMGVMLQRWGVYAALVVLTALSAGCATGPNANPKDPLEPFNRKVSVFNDA
jgi:phospholipid-binding lipoprotein MlaA